MALDAGSGAARTMALSAAAHVPAQVAFGVVFAAALVRSGLLAGLAGGTLTYVACSIWLEGVAPAAAVSLAAVLLVLAPRVMTGGPPRPGGARRVTTTALTCAAASAIVAIALLTSRLAGPAAAGAVAAFPSISATLAVAVAWRDGRQAGAHALTGLVRSLPCYLAFCLVVALSLPAGPAIAGVLGLLACGATASGTWRGVELTR